MKQKYKRVSRTRKKLGILGIIGTLLVSGFCALLIHDVTAVTPVELNPDDWDLELAFLIVRSTKVALP